MPKPSSGSCRGGANPSFDLLLKFDIASVFMPNFVVLLTTHIYITYKNKKANRHHPEVL